MGIGSELLRTAVTFTTLIPDMDHFEGSEGSGVLPLLHPGGSPNLDAEIRQSSSGVHASTRVTGEYRLHC